MLQHSDRLVLMIFASWILPLIVGCTRGTPAVDSSPDTDADADTAADTDTDADTGDTQPVAPDYGTLGPWSAGVLTGLATGSDGTQTPVDVWYPSAETEGAAHRYGWDSWGFVGTALEDVEPACAEARPVMVHSHGNRSIRWEMFWLPEFAATHGWLIVAADHPGNTFVDDTTDYATLLTQRPGDVRAAYDWLVDQAQQPTHPLHGCVDPTAGYVVTGYSFGGYTAYVTAGGTPSMGWSELADERVTAVVTYAPWDAHALAGGTADIAVPVLSIGGDRDATVGTDYRALHGSVVALPRALGAWANAGHYSFTPIYCSGAGDGCGDGWVATEVFTPAVSAAVLAFLGHLRGEQGAIEQLPAVEGELTWELALGE